MVGYEDVDAYYDIVGMHVDWSTLFSESVSKPLAAAEGSLEPLFVASESDWDWDRDEVLGLVGPPPALARAGWLPHNEAEPPQKCSR